MGCLEMKQVCEVLKSECRHVWCKFGSFFRQSDRKKIQRFRCRICGSTISEATSDPCYYQKKRLLNASVFGLLVSGVSQRRCAKLLVVNRKTIIRKFLFLGHFASIRLQQQNEERLQKVTIMEFDDLETIEHSKGKPLSITLAVEHKTRHILGFEVSQMPAKGKIAKMSRAKYGPRKDLRGVGRKNLFVKIKPFLASKVLIKSDENPHYPADVKRHFPTGTHKTFKGRRGCVVGQGELKRGGFDPLFSLNHTCAKLRADINRLFRRTWCTTKKASRLSLHIALMAIYHNYEIRKKSKTFTEVIHYFLPTVALIQ